MRAGSFDLPPVDGKALHQVIDLFCVMVRVGGQVGVFSGGQDGAMTEDFLDLKQIDTGFDQVGGIASASSCAE